MTSWEGNTRFASSGGVIALSPCCFFAKRKERLELMWFQPIWSPQRLELERRHVIYKAHPGPFPHVPKNIKSLLVYRNYMTWQLSEIPEGNFK